MPETAYLIAVAVVAAAVTWGLRALPFLAVAPLRHSALLQYLSERLPIGLMLILAVYTLRHVNILDPASIVPATTGTLITAILHLWRQNMLLSIAAGTASYVILVSLVITGI